MTQQIADFLEIFQDTSKTVVMSVLLMISVFFRIKGYVDSEGFVDLMRTTTVAYFGTSTVVHFTSMIKDHLANKLEQIKSQALPDTKGN